jgi:hypothetical protein
MLATEGIALAGSGGNPIVIEPYNSSGDPLAYVLKLADRDDCQVQRSAGEPRPHGVKSNIQTLFGDEKD